MTLEQMKSVDIRTVDINTLKEAGNVTVDMSMPKLKRMGEVERQIGNLYCFRLGRTAVKIGHADTTASVDDRVESLMRTV